MTDGRQRRIQTLAQAARRKSENKTKAAEAAIRILTKRGEPITFQAVQREAGVSHSFLYTHPDLRDRIERLRQRNRPTPSPTADHTSDTDSGGGLGRRVRQRQIPPNPPSPS
jgi:predicted Zn-dependent protease